MYTYCRNCVFIAVKTFRGDYYLPICRVLQCHNKYDAMWASRNVSI